MNKNSDKKWSPGFSWGNLLVGFLLVLGLSTPFCFAQMDISIKSGTSKVINFYLYGTNARDACPCLEDSFRVNWLEGYYFMLKFL